MSTRRLIRDNRAHIDDVVQVLSERHHFTLDEQREFTALVERRLAEGDVELPRAFLDQSGLRAYLLTLVTQMFLQFQEELWGTWRPTAHAQRLGPTAVLLEELVVRDGLPMAEAIELMQTAHHVSRSNDALEALYVELRLDAQPRAAEAPPRTAASSRVPARPDSKGIDVALREALKLLTPDDQLVLAMRYADGEPVSRIAKTLRYDLRPLHRRIEQATEVVRGSLLSQGVQLDDVNTLLGHPPAEHAERQARWWKAAVPRLSY